MRHRRRSVASQLLLLQTLLLAFVLAAAGLASVLLASNREDVAAADEVRDIAGAIAANPLVAVGAVSADPSAALQPYAESVRAATGVDFVVIMTPDGIRWTHPDPAQIGRTYLGTIAPAAAGGTVVETYTGTLGPSVRSVVPVRLDGAAIVALVSVGITTEAINTQFLRQLPFLVAALVVLLLIALAGAALVSRRLRRQTRGLDAEEISRLYSAHDAVLHSVREGLMVVDTRGRVSVANDEARRLLGLDAAAEVIDVPVAQLPLPATVRDLLAAGREAADEMHLAADRVLVVNQSAANWEGRAYGTVATFRDRTELDSLTGELDTVRALAESLRSQAHEAANRLHTVVMLVETGRYEKAVEYATTVLALSQQLTDRVMNAVDEPVLAALLLGKTAQAAERGVELRITADSRTPANELPISDLVTIIGNLLDNAIDASAEAAVAGLREVVVTIRPDGSDLLIQVGDSGPGLPAELVESAFTRGWSTKVVASGPGRGLGLALVNQVVRRCGGTISVLDVRHAAEGNGSGAQFTVRLPVDRIGAELAGSAATGAADNR